MRSAKVSGNALVFFSALAWSTTGLFTRIVSTDIPSTLFWRSVFGGLSVMAICFFLRPAGQRSTAFKFSKVEVVVAAIMGSSMIALVASFFYTAVANVYFVYGSMPLLTLLLSVILLQDKATPVGIVCCLLCLLGTAVVVWGADTPGDMIGLLLALFMTLLMALMTVATKLYPEGDMTKATYLGAFMAAAAVLPFSSLGSVSQHDFFWLAGYGISNIGLGFCVYLWGVARTTAISAALVTLTQIPIAPVWTWVLYDESVGLLTITGGMIMLIAATVYIVTDRDDQSETEIR